jgi:3-oxoacyl-[acyl-carrier-protein] synthase-3
VNFGDSISIAAAATWFPESVETVAQAVARGALTADEVERAGVDRVLVSAETGAEMAVWAGRRALDAAGRPGADVALVVHAWAYYQGHDFWSPPHFVAHQVGADSAYAIGVQLMSNGGAGSLELAATRMVADPAVSLALVTSGDRFGPPAFDRWRTDYGTVYGDCGTAVVLARAQAGDTGLRLVAVGSVSLPWLESAHRDPLGFSDAARVRRPVMDIRSTLRAFFADESPEALVSATRAAVAGSVRATLAEAGYDPQDQRLRLVVLPRLGPSSTERIYLPGVREVTPAPVSRPGADTGHLGAGDTAAALAQLGAPGALAPGEVALVVSGGAGFSFSCLLVRAT